MAVNFLTEEKENLGNRDMLLQKTAENTIGGACNYRGSFKEKITVIIMIRKIQLKFVGRMMKKEGLDNLPLTRHTKDKRGKGNQ